MAYDQAKFWREYYRREKERLKREKRKKYRTDPFYRERAKNRAREAYAEKVGAEGGEVQSFGTPVHGSSVVQGPDGRMFYSTAWAARFAGVTEQTIRRWIKTDIIPKPFQENNGGRRWRWFTPEQLRILKKFKGYAKKPVRNREALTKFAFKHWEERGDDAEIIERANEAGAATG